jgi:hypothetical protein
MARRFLSSALLVIVFFFLRPADSFVTPSSVRAVPTATSTTRHSSSQRNNSADKEEESLGKSTSLAVVSTVAAVLFFCASPAVATDSSVFSGDYADPYHPLCERHISVNGDRFLYQGTSASSKEGSVLKGCSPSEIQQFGLQAREYTGSVKDNQIRTDDGILYGVWEPKNSASTKLGFEGVDGIRWSNGNKWIVASQAKVIKMDGLNKVQENFAPLGLLGKNVFYGYVGFSILVGGKALAEGYKRIRTILPSKGLGKEEEDNFAPTVLQRIQEVFKKASDKIESSMRAVNRVGELYQAEDHNYSTTPAEDDEPKDLTTGGGIANKLQSTFNFFQRMDSSNKAKIAFAAYLKLLGDLKEERAVERDRRYTDTGIQVKDTHSALQGMDELFDLACWAYNELPDQTLKDALAGRGFTMLRHDVSSRPGSASHYVALCKKRKLAVIGIRGTNSLEDLLTDCCMESCAYQLPGPFVKGGATEIRAHDGILQAAQQLADDVELLLEELLFPRGYKVVITGHSLGASVGSVLGVLLRARFPFLLDDPGRILKVVGFGSPPVLDSAAARACAPFNDNIINNSDIIPRFSLSNLAILMEHLKTVNLKLEEKGMRPRNLRSTAAYLKMLAAVDKGKPIMTIEEVREAMGKAYANVEIDHQDCLYVPGRILHMYDLWSKEGYGKTQARVQQRLKDVDEVSANRGELQKAVENVRTAERMHVNDGTSKVLRYIEMDARMMTDHLCPAYKKSIESLLLYQESSLHEEERQFKIRDKIRDIREFFRPIT